MTDLDGPRSPLVTSQPRIGARLKAARLAQRMTLTDVASSSGLTKGFLSRLERDQASASVAALMRVCHTLDIAVGSLFEAPPNGEVVRRGRYPLISFGGERMSEYLLTPRGERRMQAIFSEIEPGGGSGGEGYTLPSDVDFVFVLGGRIEITFEEDVVSLGAGDAFTFHPSARHSFRSVGGEGPARVLWVFCPALPDDARQPH